MSIKIIIELEQNEAWAFAEFLKRTGYDTFKSAFKNEEELHDAQSAAYKLQKTLSENGFDPR